MSALLCYYLLTQPNPSATAADSAALEAHFQRREAVAAWLDQMDSAYNVAIGRSINPFDDSDTGNPFEQSEEPHGP